MYSHTHHYQTAATSSHTAQGQGHVYKYRTAAQHSTFPGENGYQSKVKHFTTDSLLMLLANNCEEIFTVHHRLIIKINQFCILEHWPISHCCIINH